jgi:hypothetical protein
MICGKDNCDIRYFMGRSLDTHNERIAERMAEQLCASKIWEEKEGVTFEVIVTEQEDEVLEPSLDPGSMS